jgi:transposase
MCLLFTALTKMVKLFWLNPRCRAALSELIAGLPPCVIGMEARSGAHYWARLFRQYGHDVRLMAPKFVSPYRMAGKTGKNDAADAIAICEAVAAAYALCTSQRRKPAGNAMLTSDKTGIYPGKNSNV